jgi:hypothetical protein
VWEIDRAVFVVPDLWRAYMRRVSPDTILEEAGADRLARGIACIFPEQKTRVLWQGDANWRTNHLLPEGKIVVSCHKHLEFLSLYSGRRRVTLAEAQQLLETV